MTPPQEPTVPSEPTTEAGRRHVAEFDVGQYGRVKRAVLAIEAEARADALREAAERVRGLSVDHDVGDMYLAVLAILERKP